ncbi:MAG: cyclic nucleotide-binding domain-containing protein [Desulfobacteraceae bacterium]|nr:cyclic nucleotide-binding domain-containing protein [Desulfobacteraceae bacterium]
MKMHISQKDLLWVVDKDFVKSFMDIAEKVSCEAGDFLFRQGDKAEHFYFLIKGRISLSIGEMGQLVYIINNEGETFGWSSIAAGVFILRQQNVLSRQPCIKSARKDLINSWTVIRKTV